MAYTVETLKAELNDQPLTIAHALSLPLDQVVETWLNTMAGEWHRLNVQQYRQPLTARELVEREALGQLLQEYGVA